MTREQEMNELQAEIQDVLFNAKYVVATMDERVSLNQRGHELIGQLRKLENGVD